ncbi:MAG TPA: MOSC domain-containing protein [Hydrogenophaga sp.]
MNASVASVASVVAVSASPIHGFSKQQVHKIRLLTGLGVEGDAHCGVTVQHRSRVAQDPTQPNLRQVHLIQEALFDALRLQSFAVEPGQLGENITTRHLDLLALPAGAELHIGDCAVVRLTGLRNPCEQLNRFQDGLMAAMISRLPDGRLVRKAGVMGVVLCGGAVRPGDPIAVKLPAGPLRALHRV